MHEKLEKEVRQALMRTSEQAREIAIAMLAADDFAELEPVLIDSHIEEFDVGWIYYYQSARFLETGDFRESLAGNAPLFVPRNGAPATFISYHRPTVESMEAFSFCGDANARENPEVEVAGGQPGAPKIAATQCIRNHSELGLSAAKEAIDKCLSGTAVRIRTQSVGVARKLASELARLDFAARVTYGGDHKGW